MKVDKRSEKLDILIFAYQRTAIETKLYPQFQNTVFCYFDILQSQNDALVMPLPNGQKCLAQPPFFPHADLKF